MLLIIPWIFFFSAAYLSRLPEALNFTFLQGVLSIVELISPCLVAFYLLTREGVKFKDIRHRFSLKNLNKFYLFLALFLTFIALVMAQFISLIFGHGLEQFYISGKTSFESALFNSWFILIFAAIVEELAWHTYGTDALRAKFSLFTSSMIFAFYWALWHLPLSFIKGYYHSEVALSGLLYSLNFIISLFVFVILMNRLYFKTNRNITIAILFHLFANLTNEIFATHPDSKVIQTAILLLIAIAVVAKNKELFFSSNFKFDDV
ncbi:MULTISPECIES: CPBP family intramembrane glutamic endopeptidase [unclassified Campylobacter]|uniref:CPBP family intramembrane glutamic endopeptidase n=1 Tax=unclassified Campylobacter TaxID=2593542 RepID=UPI001474E2F0|nr:MULTISPECIES: CPBP family intramembrane glutamic endopeptidase [unclassified Campylobacter]